MTDRITRKFVSDIREGDAISEIYLCSELSTGQTNKGKGSTYLRVKLQDRTGTIECRVWDRADDLARRFQAGDYVKVSARASVYQGNVQLTISDMDAVPVSEVDPALFLPATRCDVDWMWGRLRGIISEMQDAHLRELVNRLLDDEEFARRFRQAPAAMGNHHAWIGGLLEHTLSLIYLIKRITPHYPQASQDLCIVGAVFHDMGKVWEYSWDSKIDMTDAGRLVGHLAMAIVKIEEITREIPGFPEPLKLECQHLVAAHHGQLEFGSPKLPQTLEAMIVHMVDNLDSKVNQMTTALTGNPEVHGRWTQYQKSFQTPLYRGGRARELPAGFVPLPEEQEGREGLSGQVAVPAAGDPPTSRPVPLAPAGPRPAKTKKPDKNGEDAQSKGPELPAVRDLFSR
ncbi:MAG: HD domain-containing protein [Deltaproteobacteria bacterium]|nr:HD domain-containing protein [Deltaproteobacteria bacterium]